MTVCANGAVIYDAATDRVIGADALVDALTELADAGVPGAGWRPNGSA